MSRKLEVLSGLALRNLRRYLRRTLLTSSAMVIGGTFLMISLPLGDGTHEAWIESAVRRRCRLGVFSSVRVHIIQLLDLYLCHLATTDDDLSVCNFELIVTPADLQVVLSIR